MNPHWSSMREPDLDPEIEAAARRVMDGVDDLRTARLRAERMDVAEILRQPTPVTAELMSDLAALPHASPELRAYAERVRTGECRWSEIELFARPLPPEAVELKASPNFLWEWHSQPPPPPPSPPPAPSSPRTKRADNVVGPSDWPDDFDEYPGPKSWLV
ncbi:hypothetical protein ACL02S_14740 [Nocardia sp. 004]|uniref:hypothetical protein n=1 Tax=Nocardia sp. 004 TaxID=3385978 RepID=UPI0039A22E08